MGKQFSKCASAPYCGSDKIDALSDMDEKEPSIKIVFCSCNEETTKHQPLWNIMRQVNADAYIFLGDMIYMDLKIVGGGMLAKPKVKVTFEQRYNTLLCHKDFPFSTQIQLKDKFFPLVLPTWNDHDYGQDEGNKNYENKHEAKSAFLKFAKEMDPNKKLKNKWEEISKSSERGIYYYYDLNINGFKVRICMFDTRWYRDNTDILGKEQKAWFENEIISTLSDDHIDWLLLCSSCVFGFKASGTILKQRENERWDKESLIWLSSQLKRENFNHRTILLSGDIHCSVIHRYGYTYELTSSSLTHSIATPLAVTENIFEKGKKESSIINANSFGFLKLYHDKFTFAAIDKECNQYIPLERKLPTLQEIKESNNNIINNNNNNNENKNENENENKNEVNIGIPSDVENFQQKLKKKQERELKQNKMDEEEQRIIEEDHQQELLLQQQLQKEKDMREKLEEEKEQPQQVQKEVEEEPQQVQKEEEQVQKKEQMQEEELKPKSKPEPEQEPKQEQQQQKEQPRQSTSFQASQSRSVIDDRNEVPFTYDKTTTATMGNMMPTSVSPTSISLMSKSQQQEPIPPPAEAAAGERITTFTMNDNAIISPEEEEENNKRQDNVAGTAFYQQHHNAFDNEAYSQTPPLQMKNRNSVYDENRSSNNNNNNNNNNSENNNENNDDNGDNGDNNDVFVNYDDNMSVSRTNSRDSQSYPIENNHNIRTGIVDRRNIAKNQRQQAAQQEIIKRQKLYNNNNNNYNNNVDDNNENNINIMPNAITDRILYPKSSQTSISRLDSQEQMNVEKNSIPFTKKVAAATIGIQQRRDEYNNEQIKNQNGPNVQTRDGNFENFRETLRRYNENGK